MSLKIQMFVAIAVAVTLPASLFGQINVPERFVQIRSLDFVNEVIEIHNFGAVDENLGGWRFCSHDEDQDRRYSATGGFSGMTLAAGESMFIHYNNDASLPGEINRSAIGGNFALPLDTDGSYSIQFYFQTPFGSGNNISDHVQVSVFGADDVTADERSDEAQNGGVWTDQSLWVSILPETTRVVLRDGVENSELHGPDDYDVEFTFEPGDVNGDNNLNLLDVAPFVDAISNAIYIPAADLNTDGLVNLLDVAPFIDAIAG